MVSKLIPLFRNYSQTQEFSGFIQQLDSAQKGCIALINAIRNDSSSYSNGMLLFEITRIEIEHTKEYLLSLNSVYSGDKNFDKLLEKTFDCLDSINTELALLHSDLDHSDKQFLRDKNKSDSSINSMNWCSSLSNLNTLIESLVEGNFITARENPKAFYVHFIYENIADNDFKPIKWNKSKVLLAYLINSLFEKGFINPTNKWADPSKHFLYNGSKPEYLSQDNYESPAPNGANDIDEIINKIL